MDENRIVGFSARAGLAPPGPKPLPSTAALKYPSLAEIRNIDTDGREWFFEYILPAGAFLIVGRPKVGKSWLLLQLALCAGGGGKFLGYENLGVWGVLYIAAEDDIGRIQSRMDRYRITDFSSNVHVMVRDELLRTAAAFGEHMTFGQFIDRYLEEHPATRFVIMDTESTCRQMWGAAVTDHESSITRKDYAEVREFDSIALKRRAFIGLVNHTSKRKGNGQWLDIHELINRTNTALAGASGSIVLADPPDRDPMDPKSKLRVLGIRGRDIKEDVLLAVEQNEFAVFESRGAYTAHVQTQAESAVMECLEHLHKNDDRDERWFSAKIIAEEISLSAGAVQRGISRMMRAGRHTWKEFRVETKPRKGIRLIEKFHVNPDNEANS